MAEEARIRTEAEEKMFRFPPAGTKAQGFYQREDHESNRRGAGIKKKDGPLSRMNPGAVMIDKGLGKIL